MQVEPADVYDMMAAFLRRDMYTRGKFDALLDQREACKDTSTLRELNATIRRCLMGSRRFLIAPLPPDTTWFKVRMDLAEFNTLTEVIIVWPHQDLPVIKDSAEYGDCIFFGHDFTKLMLIEGNKRFQAWIRDGRLSVIVTVYIGISPNLYCWFPKFLNNVQSADFECDNPFDFGAGYSSY